MSNQAYDVAVVGSGFAGSLVAMICHRLRRSVILLEKGKHPRFTIGESSTPLTNLMLEDLSIRYRLPSLTPLAKWGTWQKAYPDIACGLKRGFAFYHHTLGQPDTADSNRESQLLVAASPNDQVADTHWYRPDFDHFVAMEAARIGVNYLDEANLTALSEHDDGITLSGSRRGEPLTISVKLLVDATGPRGFLHRSLNLPELPFPNYPHTQALYSHFRGVASYADQLTPSDEEPPYPIDAAAVHHVFDGGWIWVLQFNNGLTSAGVAATNEAAERLKLSDGADAWTRLLDLIPKLRNQFAIAEPIRPFLHVPKLSFRSGVSAGKRWIQLPSAAGFVDPLFSTGFAMTLLGISRLAKAMETAWDSEHFSQLIKAVADHSDQELLATSRLIGSLYANMNNFPVFVALSHLYFTAVIFSETARRLGKPELADAFLLHNDSYFGPECLKIFNRVKTTKGALDSKLLCADIIRAIEPLNLGGLGAPDRRNWYPVDVGDLFRGAHKVQATQEEITALLERSGFFLARK